LFQRLVIALFVLFIHIAPVAFDVAVEGFLDELSKVGVLAGQIVNFPRGYDLPGAESWIDYKQRVYGLYLLS